MPLRQALPLPSWGAGPSLPSATPGTGSVWRSVCVCSGARTCRMRHASRGCITRPGARWILIAVGRADSPNPDQQWCGESLTHSNGAAGRSRRSADGPPAVTTRTPLNSVEEIVSTYDGVLYCTQLAILLIPQFCPHRPGTV